LVQYISKFKKSDYGKFSAEGVAIAGKAPADSTQVKTPVAITPVKK